MTTNECDRLFRIERLLQELSCEIHIGLMQNELPQQLEFTNIFPHEKGYVKLGFSVTRIRETIPKGKLKVITGGKNTDA